MSMTYLLYNPLSNNAKGEETKDLAIARIKNIFDDIKPISVTNMSHEEIYELMHDGDNVVLSGGDGTLHHFANFVKTKNVDHKKINYYFLRSGTGNDFLKDIGHPDGEKPILINKYLEHLPKAYVGDKMYYFMNNLSFGVDGAVCEEIDRLKLKGKKRLSYTWTAIKLILFKYKKPSGYAIVDGVKYDFDHIFLASTFNSRYAGGGMMFAPEQDRSSGYFHLCLMHAKGNFKLLSVFGSVFKGKHVKYKDIVFIKKAKRIEMHFDSPRALHIDGEVKGRFQDYVAEYSD